MKEYRLAVVGFMVIGLLSATFSHAELRIEDLAGMWLFEEGKGTEVIDSSENGNHGRFNGTPQWVDKGAFGGALNCARQGHVLIPDSDSLDLDAAWTLTTWVNINPPMERWQHVINKRFDVQDNYAIRLQDTGAWEVYINNGGWVRLGDPGPAKGGEWVHLAATYDGSDALILYVDGEQVAIRRGVSPSPVNDIDLRFGNYQGNSGGMDGMIDDTAIFTVDLTPKEIVVIKENGLAVAMNMQPVEPSGKLSACWGDIKKVHQ